ncbi:MAG: SDR family NAD(P)-dependent oxidoreductase [Ktedonobacterales bacterium]
MVTGKPLTGECPGALIVGASGGIGAALAHELARRGYTLALVARRAEALDTLAAELNAATRSGAAVPCARTYVHDVRDYDAAPALFERVLRDLGAAGSELRVAIYASGVMPAATQPGGWTFDDERAIIETNVTGAIRWLDLAAETFAKIGQGTLVGISSVAGDRGRKGNSVYMASKAALSTYLESLRYRLAGTGVRVVTVKPGYVATPLLAGATPPRPLVTSPEATAARIARLLARGPTVAYVPGYWRLIMALVRAIPARLMPKMPL